MYWIICNDIGIFWCGMYNYFIGVVMVFDIVVQGVVVVQWNMDYVVFSLFSCFMDCFGYFFGFIFVKVDVVFLVIDNNQSSEVKVFIIFDGF